MALPILDGNQSATTLSSILTGGEHIPAHTVVSLGTQAITDMRGAVSGSVVSISNFPSTQTIAGTVTVSNAVALAQALLDQSASYASLDVNIGGVGSVTLPISGTITVGNSLTIQSGNITIEEAFGENSFMPISGTVTANVSSQDLYGQQATTAGSFLRSALYYEDLLAGAGEFLRVNNDNDGGLPIRTVGTDLVNVSGTVTANINTFPDATTIGEQIAQGFTNYGSFDVGISGTANVSGTVTLGASSSQIGSVTASISNSVTIASFATSVTARLINPAGTAVTYAEVGTAGNPSIDVLSVQGVTSGTAIPISISSVTIGSLPAISGTVTANTFALQGTAVTTSNFTSTTASTVLAGFNATREVLTIFNEGAGNLHICAGATCTTIAYQVRLSAGDYYEVPLNQTSLTHSAVFATAGTARVTQVS